MGYREQLCPLLFWGQRFHAKSGARRWAKAQMARWLRRAAKRDPAGAPTKRAYKGYEL